VTVRATPLVAGAAWLVAVTAVALSAVLAPGVVFNGGDSVFVVVFLVFVTAGALVAHRTGGNAVGWQLVGVGVVLAATITAQALESWLGRGLWRDLAYWAGETTWVVLVALLLALVAVFPTGRVVPGWPRVHLWAGLGFVVGAALLNGFAPSLDEGITPNPFANPGLERFGQLLNPVVLVSMVTLLVFGAGSIFLRYRRGGSMERQQIKWFIFAAAMLPLAFALADITQTTVGPMILGLAALAFPIAIAVAIFKYRLYDIDRIINRTLVYGVVVGLLGLVFAAGALWLPSLLPFDNNNFAVAASTLAVFFLFNPLRRRVQRLVDRRFYRSRYDAQRVADEFSARLRDQVDPDVVAEEWADVVQRTLQPASVAVWLQGPS
jgi:hypothetical protein